MPDQATVASNERHGVELAFAQQFSEKYIAAWNSHQPGQVLSLMTDDVVYEDAAWPSEIHGHDAVRAFLEATWCAIPDMNVTLEKSVFLDPQAPNTAAYWHATATHTGRWDPPGLAATGRRISFHGATFLEFRDGKVSRVRVVYDVAEILHELGVLPKGRSRGERLTMLAANLRTRLRRH